MAYMIGVVSQKGGVGKSTLARALAVAYARAGWSVKVADLDINQGTSFEWQKRRLQAEIEPVVPVEVFATVTQARRVEAHHDLLIFDGAPHATQGTVEIAKTAGMVILPTGLSLDDLLPTVLLANTLVSKHGVPVERLAIALSRAGESTRELDDARAYLAGTPYHILEGHLQEKTAFRLAQDEGRAVIECKWQRPREQAEQMVDAIISRFEFLTN